jgi:hypothetical protein
MINEIINKLKKNNYQYCSVKDTKQLVAYIEELQDQLKLTEQKLEVAEQKYHAIYQR